MSRGGARAGLPEGVPGEVRQRGTLIGIAACAPLAIGAALIVGVFYAPNALFALAHRLSIDWPAWTGTYIAASFAHALGFAWHAWRNERLRGSAQRGPWVVAMLALSSIAAPVYWWRGLARGGIEAG